MRNSLKQTSPTYSNSSVLCSILSAEWIWMNSFNMRRILLRALRAVDYSMIGMSQQKYSSAHGNNAFSARSSSFVPALPCQCGIVRNSRRLRVLEDVISLQNALLIAPWLLTHGKTKPWYQLRALPWQWWFAWLLRFGQSKRVIIKACFKRWSIGMNRCTFRGRDVLDCQKCQLNNIPCPATQKWSFLSVSQPSQHVFLIASYLQSINLPLEFPNILLNVLSNFWRRSRPWKWYTTHHGHTVQRCSMPSPLGVDELQIVGSQTMQNVVLEHDPKQQLKHRSWKGWENGAP